MRCFLLKVIFMNISALYLIAYVFDIQLVFCVYLFSILLLFKW